MRARTADLLRRARDAFARGRFTSVLEMLAPVRQARTGTRAGRLEALELSAAAASQLAWYGEEAAIRRRRIALLERAGLPTGEETAALGRALCCRGCYDEAAEVLIPLAGAIGRTERIDYLTVQAILLVRRDADYLGAARLLREAIGLARGERERLRRGKLRSSMGHALRFAGRIEEAQRELRSAQAELEPLREQDHEAAAAYAKCEFWLGDTYRLAGDVPRAYASYVRAKEVLGARASAHFTKSYYGRLGAVFFALTEYAKARDAYLHPECLAAVETIGNPAGFFWCYLGAARAAIAEGDVVQGQELVTKARGAAGTTPSRNHLAHLALSGGDLMRLRSAWAAADELYREAEEHFRALGAEGHVPGLVDCLVSRGYLALGRRDHREAREAAERADELAARSGSLAIQSRPLELMSDILAEESGDLDDLFHYVRERTGRCPTAVQQFKITANLLHYARRFNDYELDVELETQLGRLRAELDEAVHARLRRAYVDRRFAQLIAEHLLSAVRSER